MELFNEGGLKDEGGSVDPVSGNDVPVGSTKKEVRDDIPAMLSEGEFVFPADVTRFIGLEKLMEQRQEAKMGLKTMEAMGQMGNSEEATMPDDMPFGPADLVILGKPEEGEPKEMYGGGMVYANQGTFATGIGGYQQSVFQGQPQTSAPYVPPSSVAPPPPAPSPAGGYMPKFMTNNTTPFDDGSLAPKTTTGTTGTTGTTTTSNTGTTGTTDDFVPTVDDVYTQKEYFNPETGETKIINFYNGNPVNKIPEGFVLKEDYVKDETTTTDLESTSIESTTVTDDNSSDKNALTKMVTDKQTKEANDFKVKLAKTMESGSKEDLMSLYVKTQVDKKIMTGLAFTGIGLIPSLVGRFTLSSREKDLEEALNNRFGEGWEDSQEFKSISEASILDKAKTAISDAFNSSFTKEGRDAYYENYKGKYATESHPLSRGVKSSLTPREQQAFDNAVSSGNTNVANHYAIVNQSRAKLKSAIESGKSPEEMKGLGLSSYDIERGQRLYKKKVEVKDPSSKVSSPLTGLTTTDDSRSAQETLNKEAAAKASRERRKKREQKSKDDAKKAIATRKAAVTKAKSISKDVKGKGADAVSATQKAKAFVKGGLAGRK